MKKQYYRVDNKIKEARTGLCVKICDYHTFIEEIIQALVLLLGP